MATTTYFGWTTPDNTAYVKDGASAIRSLGSSVDTSLKSSYNTAYMLHIQDQKTSGTMAGTFTSGAFRTRDLNTVITNTIAGASLASNQFTLPAGTYYVEAIAPASIVNENKAIIYNVTDSSNAIIGTSSYSGGGSTQVTNAVLNGKFTIAGTKTFELRHRAASTGSTYGFGIASGFSVIEVYAEVKIWKVG